MPETTAREQKLIQYLNEAYGKEKELETALQAHIKMTTRPAYKKRLQDHLKETKAQSRALEKRIKQLGGKAELGVVAQVADTAAAVANKGVSLAKGQLHAMRGSGEAEKMLKNAKTEYFNEHEEIATYIGIETLAEALGDTGAHVHQEHVTGLEELVRAAAVLLQLHVKRERPLVHVPRDVADRRAVDRRRDAGAQRGRDVATPPSAPASAARLNLDLPISQRGPVAGSRSRALLEIAPNPPELKTRLQKEMEKALREDCRKAYAENGLLALGAIALDALRAKGCKF